MIEAVSQGAYDNQTVKIEDGVRKVLTWKKNERMGGKIPVWIEEKHTAKTDIEQNLNKATLGETDSSFDSALAYSDTHSNAVGSDPEAFGFGDLIDMINPLQHLPLVNIVYRELTGDEIRPIAQIIGGGVFGGPAGVASGLVNTVVEYETGKDLTGNVVALVTEGQTPNYKSTPVSDNPEKRLNKTLETIDENPNALPGSVIGFADLGYGKREVYERTSVADGRTAGTMVHRRTEVAAPENQSREPITEFNLSPMPLLNRSQDLLFLQEEELN